MAQNTTVSLPVIRYSRADFAALRAVMNKMPIARILDLYYCEDDRDLLKLNTGNDLRDRMDAMRDFLIQRATDTNPHLATFLQDARKTSVWSRSAIGYLVNAADEDTSAPKLDDPLSFWFRNRVSDRLKQEGCHSIQDLITMINLRGGGWHRPIPLLGGKKAAAIVDWIRKHRTIGSLLDEASLLPVVPRQDCVVLDPICPTLIPFERIALPAYLSGQDGINRCRTFCQIGARTDLEALAAYLIKHSEREAPKTHRAYKKELERYLLWCVLYLRKPMSSILAEDCESYKAFLADPPSSWIGNQPPYLRAARNSRYWRPFSGIPSLESQRYAVRVIRTFHAYLVNVRYLMGNPWKEVNDPKTVKRINKIKIEKALPTTLWSKLAGAGGILDTLCLTDDDELKKRWPVTGPKKSLAAQFRVARAAILLMGESGLRREEAATATRATLKPAVESTDGFWEITVVGKGLKERTVFFPGRVAECIFAHWADRNVTYEEANNETPLFAPVAVPGTKTAKERHAVVYEDNLPVETGYTPDSLNRLVSTALTRIARDSTLDLSYAERMALETASSHPLRHTFGTNAVAGDNPLDVVQFLMGHESLDTTSIYVQAPRKRAIGELEKASRRARQDNS